MLSQSFGSEKSHSLCPCRGVEIQQISLFIFALLYLKGFSGDSLMMFGNAMREEKFIINPVNYS